MSARASPVRAPSGHRPTRLHQLRSEVHQARPEDLGGYKVSPAQFGFGSLLGACQALGLITDVQILKGLGR